MKHFQNLDCMTTEELEEYVRSLKNDLSTFQYDTKTRHTLCRLQGYAHIKILSIGCRLRGYITIALEMEKILDESYKTLPEDAKW